MSGLAGGQKKQSTQSHLVSKQKIQTFGSADKRGSQVHDMSLNSNGLMDSHHLNNLKLQ